MTEAIKFRKYVMDRFILAMEEAIRNAQDLMKNMTPEQMKDDKFRQEMIELMAEVSRSQEMVDAYKAADGKLQEAIDTHTDRVVEKQPIGFMNFKEAA